MSVRRVSASSAVYHSTWFTRIAGDVGGGDARRRACFTAACARFLGSPEDNEAQQKYASLLTGSGYREVALPVKIAACEEYVQAALNDVAALGGVPPPPGRIPLMTAVRPALTAAEGRRPVVFVLGTAAHKGAVSANESATVPACGYDSTTANVMQTVQNAVVAAFPVGTAPVLVIVDEDIEEEEHVVDAALGIIAPDVPQEQKCTPLVGSLFNALLAAVGAGGGRVALVVASGGGESRFRRLLRTTRGVTELEEQKAAALRTTREVVLPHLTHAAPGAKGGAHRDDFNNFAAVALQFVYALTGDDHALALATAREAALYASSAHNLVLAAAFVADGMTAVLAGDIERAAGLVYEAQAAAFAATAPPGVLADLARIHGRLSLLGDPDAPVPLLDWVDGVEHESIVDADLCAHVDAAFDAAETLGSAHHDAASRAIITDTARLLADGEYLQYRQKHPECDESARSGGSYVVALSTLTKDRPSGVYPGSVTSGEAKPHDTLVQGRHADRKGALRAGGNDGLKKARHQPVGTWAGGAVVTHSLSTTAEGDTFEVTRYVEALINVVIHLTHPEILLTTRKSE
jgi:hypothetical protein